MQYCAISPLGGYGKPWKGILLGCEWCKDNVE